MVGRHYIAIFAVFNDSSAAETSTEERGDEYYPDVDCSTRRFVLLAFRPVEDEEDLGTQSLFDLIADTLSIYNKPWEAVAFMVGDNCSVSQCIGRRIGAIPLIGCASHRFNLAVKDHLNQYSTLLDKIHNLMKKFSTLKGRAILRKVTHLAPVSRNDTRWSIIFSMVELEPSIRTIDHGTIAANDFQQLLLSRRENESARDLLDELDALEGVNKELQRASLTLSGVRRPFDRVLREFPLMRDRIGENAGIINFPALESGLVKLQRHANLTSAERTACAAFQAPIEAQPTQKAETLVGSGLKKRKVARRDNFVEVGYVPPTSNECE